MRTLLSFLCCAVLGSAAFGCQAKPPDQTNTAANPPASAEKPPARVAVSLGYAPDPKIVTNPEAGDPPEGHRAFITITEEGKPPQEEELAADTYICGVGAADEKTLDQLDCFWAGQGTRFSLSRDGDSLVVHQRYIGEGMEDAPEPLEIFRYKIPEGAEVVVE